MEPQRAVRGARHFRRGAASSPQPQPLPPCHSRRAHAGRTATLLLGRSRGAASATLTTVRGWPRTVKRGRSQRLPAAAARRQRRRIGSVCLGDCTAATPQPARPVHRTPAWPLRKAASGSRVWKPPARRRARRTDSRRSGPAPPAPEPLPRKPSLHARLIDPSSRTKPTPRTRDPRAADAVSWRRASSAHIIMAACRIWSQCPMP